MIYVSAEQALLAFAIGYVLAKAVNYWVLAS